MSNSVAVIDAGGRGSALVAAYSKSPQVKKIIAIPGNDLMQVNSKKPVTTCQYLATTSTKEIIEICKQQKVTLVDVAQDNAVAVGLTDALIVEGILAVGPTKSAGEIEWNKAWARDFMKRHNISQPEYYVFHSPEEGIDFLHAKKDMQWFVKASGLAEGKGALPAKNNKQALERIGQLQKFGEAGKTYLLEKWIKNNGNIAEEFSAFAVSDGNSFQIIGYAQDHKRVFDGESGENTGGMGVSSPPLVVDKNIKQQTEEIFKKTFKGLKKEGRAYKGILYLGGIIIGDKVYVIEFNARWGDPEAQVIVPSIQNDFFEVSMAVAKGNLNTIKIKTDTKARVAVAGTSKGYPTNYNAVKGKEIFGLEKAMKIPGVTVYGAGVKINEKHIAHRIPRAARFFANGGRLFYVVGEGKNVLAAREKAYQAMSAVSVEGNNLHYRKDIGYRDVERIKKR